MIKTLGQVAREFAVLIPTVGVFINEARTRRGDVPVMFRSMNEDGSSNLEHFVEDNGRKLSSIEKQTVRSREELLMKSVFYSYHVLTTCYLIYGAITGDWDLGDPETYVPSFP